MIKVLGLALYGPLAASTRYRLGQYVPGLASHGIDLQICHLLGDNYLRRRFGGGSLPPHAAAKSSTGAPMKCMLTARMLTTRMQDTRSEEGFTVFTL